MNPFIYQGNKDLPEGTHRISPSQFSDFVSAPHRWYRKQVLGLDKFEGNTASVRGTAIHVCCEFAALGKPLTHKMICDWIDELDYNEDLDKEEVKATYQAMANLIVNEYVLQHSFLEVEHDLSHWANPRLKVSGQLDRLEGTLEDTMIVDYKSYGSTTKPKYIPQNYKYQLLVYAYLAEKNGYNPTRMRLVYVSKEVDKRSISEKTGKPIGKIYPPEVTVLTETITEEDMTFIKSMIKLCEEKLKATNDYPELTHVIWHDMRLKDNV